MVLIEQIKLTGYDLTNKGRDIIKLWVDVAGLQFNLKLHGFKLNMLQSFGNQET